MHADYSLPCVGMANAPAWGTLSRQSIRCHGAHQVPDDMRQLGCFHSQSQSLAGQKLNARRLVSPAARSFATGPSLAAPSRPCSSLSARSLVMRASTGQRWLQHGHWGRTGLRHAGSQSGSGESASGHCGLRRSVRVAANGEAGFIKGAGVVRCACLDHLLCLACIGCETCPLSKTS